MSEGKAVATIASIQRIESIRRDNNSLWMDILRVAVRHAPGETKNILRQIEENDRLVNENLRHLCDALPSW